MGYYGLAAKAGKIVCGADAVKEAIKYKKVFVQQLFVVDKK